MYIAEESLRNQPPKWQYCLWKIRRIPIRVLPFANCPWICRSPRNEDHFSHFYQRNALATLCQLYGVVVGPLHLECMNPKKTIIITIEFIYKTMLKREQIICLIYVFILSVWFNSHHRLRFLVYLSMRRWRYFPSENVIKIELVLSQYVHRLNATINTFSNIYAVILLAIDITIYSIYSWIQR